MCCVDMLVMKFTLFNSAATEFCFCDNGPDYTVTAFVNFITF